MIKFSSTDGIHFLTYTRECSYSSPETYGLIFEFKEDSQTFIRPGRAYQQLTKWASNPQLLFNWYDVGVVAQALRRYSKRIEDENCEGSGAIHSRR